VSLKAAIGAGNSIVFIGQINEDYEAQSAGSKEFPKAMTLISADSNWQLATALWQPPHGL
jgi:hypothetical protein